jgi:hypothetical protein
MGLRKRVLVFPCGSEIGLELHRSLSMAKEVVLYGASSVADHGQYVYERYIGALPFVGAPEWLEKLNAVIAEHGIEYVYPAHDSALIALAEAEERGLLRCGVLASPASSCRICRSKKRTVDFFRTFLRVPRLYQSVAEIETWPAFLKPDVGQGSKGARKVENPELCSQIMRLDPSLLLMEYLPGTEYTVDCFTNGSGDLLFSQPRTRERTANGISVRTSVVSRSDLVDMAKTINTHLRLRGAWFFQAKEAIDGQPALMEIASRVAGAMGLCRAMGVNLPLMTLYDAAGCPVTILQNPEVREMDRALSAQFRLDFHYRHVYVDLDDCLVCNGRVNVMLAAFMHQCINRKVVIHLLTRHAGNLEETLAAHRLTGILDEVIHLRARESKASAIKHFPAIFIDDSFAERSDVRSKLDIPVFAADAVEALLVPQG